MTDGAGHQLPGASEELLRLDVLGPLRVLRGGEELDLGFPQQRALLGLLVVRVGRVVPSGEIVDVLWPRRAPASAMNVVRRYAGSLRRLLEPGLPPRAPGRRLLRSAGGYRLDADEDDVDLLRFRALTKRGKRAAATGRSEAATRYFVEALGEWRGPVARGIPAAVREHAVFEEVERELLRTTRMAADAALLCGRSEQVLPRLRQALELDPLDESLHAALVMALAAAGLQAEALAAYERVRRLLAEELGVAPGTDLTTAHTKVLRQEWTPPRPPAPLAPPSAPSTTSVTSTTSATSVTSTTPTTSTTSAASPPGPRVAVTPSPRPFPQLPPSPTVFVGRRSELRRLAEVTDAVGAGTGAPPTTVLISGMPGIGKTSLAVRWAHAVAGRFPDGRLHVGLRGFDPTEDPLEPDAALRTLLTALGVPPARQPGRTDSLAGLYRSLLVGRRLLVVLDDAADTEQVRPLLPASPGSLTLVTSRNSLSALIASGAHPLRLDLPPTTDARATLTAHLDHLAHTMVATDAVDAAHTAEALGTRDTLDEIVSRCGRLPSALAIIAARAAQQPSRPLAALAALAAELRHSPRALDAFAAPGGVPDLRAVLTRSYRRLAPEHARLFRLLSLHPGPDLDAETAAALAGLPLRRARQALDALADAHLVTEHTPGRYAQHQLLRALAAELTVRLGPGGDGRDRADPYGYGPGGGA
ncbi:DNA-binding transcriptional activator of the SARP family [Streptomyces sp. cf124]|uniref:AfsR/SARP family transcriptional regulator n=1 Tax=Streptomyces sp. cf124 TaxID=1761903 RepID=UPI0008E703C8|nr:BTAD domain-containing putative transcriptional regulator [Streptomyces sp. cf124]SFM91466.1 DNA-binding transcriptional activator of the SARP family [Streptomyces sp. cf124]